MATHTILVCALLLVLSFLGCYAAQTYSNPVIDSDHPDPGVLWDHASQKYYATMTDSGDGKGIFPIFESINLANWTLVSHIFTLAGKPKWAQNNFWAPEIHIVGGKYVAYFAARDYTNMLCVGVATSDTVTGPYLDIGEALVHNSSVGNIDPTYFYDNTTQTPFVIWKEDGNDPAHKELHTPIWLAPLDPTGTKIVGAKIMILENTESWEGELVEAPWVVLHGGYYYLFYSANGYASTDYAVGVARATKLQGPYEKLSSNPMLHSNDAWTGPGHCSVLSLANAGASWAIVYHSWQGPNIGFGYPRFTMLNQLFWSSDGWPYVTNGSPAVGPTPLPH